MIHLRRSSPSQRRNVRADVAQEIPIEVHMIAGEKRSLPEDSLDAEMENAGSERVARKARPALVERVSSRRRWTRIRRLMTIPVYILITSSKKRIG